MRTTVTLDPDVERLLKEAMRRPVVLDEVHRVPALLNEVHRAIEATRRRFVLLGSSARRLKTATTKLLAGRATVARMAPLVSSPGPRVSLRTL